MFKKYTFIRQHDITDCGAACLAMVAKQHGLKMPIAKIREIAGTDKQGTNALGMIKAAENLGFSAKGVRGDQEAFFTPFPLPAIAHVVVDGSLLHYVVIHKISSKKIVIADPAKGLLTVSPEEFFNEWTGVLILLTPTNGFRRGKETKGLFERFFYLLLPQKKLIINIFLASVLHTLIGILGAFYFKFLIDDVLANGLEKTLHVLSLGAILLVFFGVILQTLRSYLLLYLSQKLDIDLLFGYYSHVMLLPLSFFGTRKTGEIISRFQDASKVRDAISGATLTILIDTMMVIAGGIILYMQNSFMFGITFLLAIAYFIIVWSFNKIYRKQNRKQMEDNAQLTSYLVESLGGMQTIKSFNAEKKVCMETESRFIKLLTSVFRLGMTSNTQGALQGFLDGAGGIVILWIGATQVIKGDLSMGQLIAFNSLLAYFLGPIKNLINLQPMMQTAIVAAERLGEILDLEVEKTEMEDRKISPEHLRGGIRIENISFRYGTRKLVLEDISMEIKQGEKVALVGESGSGKTTLAKLLLQLYTWEKGEIYINQTNLKDIKKETLRAKIAFVPQETFLFSGSIYENLTLGMDNPDMEEVVEACKMAKAHEFINELPLRYETRLEENGANLSGGQRQRLAIARAILKKPDILILDEATSNLDVITENAISQMIDAYTKGITTIIIAHRLSTIKKCDRIYVLEKGKIKESGSHTQLMAIAGQYEAMWREQTA